MYKFVFVKANNRHRTHFNGLDVNKSFTFETKEELLAWCYKYLRSEYNYFKRLLDADKLPMTNIYEIYDTNKEHEMTWYTSY